jgi:glutamine amidotransferase
MAGLAARPGLLPALQRAVLEDKRPFLGICVGMQLLAERGLEHGCHAGLGWIAGEVVRLAPADPALKVPHMGWNALDRVESHPVLLGLGPGSYCYFVHSFQLRAADPAEVLATADYGGALTAAAGRANIVGTQFHPEKSQAAGLRLLANFLAWSP